MREGKKLLILGGSGFIGARTAQAAVQAGWDVTATFNQHQLELEHCRMLPLNLADDDQQLAALLAELQPEVIINSSVPNIGVSASEAEHFKVSVGGVERLIATLRQLGQSPRLLQVSTNAVFDGTKGMYSETDEPVIANRADTFSAYGRSKAQAEKYVLQNWHDVAIVRTSLVWGRDWAGQLNRRTQNEIVSPLQTGRNFRRFDDRYITPTAVDTVALALVELLEMPFKGIINIAGSSSLSDVEFATSLARWLHYDAALIEPENRPPTMPGKLTLAVGLAQGLLKTPMLAIEEQLALVFPAKA